MIPPLFRQEVIHALVIHFPIAFLLLATFVYFLHALTPGNPKWAFLLPTGRLLLYVGLVAAWLAVWTGCRAEEIVNRTLCDPEATHRHGDWGFWAAYAFSAAGVFELLRIFLAPRLSQLWLRPALTSLLLLTLVGGSLSLVRAGHLGSALVFQQAAGVYRPSAACNEFE